MIRLGRTQILAKQTLEMFILEKEKKSLWWHKEENVQQKVNIKVLWSKNTKRARPVLAAGSLALARLSLSTKLWKCWTAQ